MMKTKTKLTYELHVLHCLNILARMAKYTNFCFNIHDSKADLVWCENSGNVCLKARTIIYTVWQKTFASVSENKNLNAWI